MQFKLRLRLRLLYLSDAVLFYDGSGLSHETTRVNIRVHAQKLYTMCMYVCMYTCTLHVCVRDVCSLEMKHPSELIRSCLDSELSIIRYVCLHYYYRSRISTLIIIIYLLIFLGK